MNSEVYCSFLIPDDRLADLEKSVAKLAKRIAKGKTAADFAPTIEATREHFVQRGDEVELYHWVTLHYQQPMVDGWHLIAVYDWEMTPDGQQLCYTSPVPGQMVLREFREVEPGRCDHCNINRARKKAMLITKDFIEYKVVGTSCIKDFLGHASAQSFMDMHAFHKMVCDGSSAPYAGPKLAYINVETIIETAAMFVRNYGFVRSGDYENTPTGSHVRRYMFPYGKDDLAFVMNHTVTADDKAFAAEAIEYIRSQSLTSDYIENVVQALDAGWVSDKRINLVASVAGVWQRQVERQAADNAPTLNEHLGSIKDRLKGVQATVQRVRYTEGMYGTTSIINLRDNNGRTLVWFASGYHEPKVGASWKLTGTVKKHDEYNGTKQTVLTRVKYEECAA